MVGSFIFSPAESRDYFGPDLDDVMDGETLKLEIDEKIPPTSQVRFYYYLKGSSGEKVEIKIFSYRVVDEYIYLRLEKLPPKGAHSHLEISR